MVINFRTFGHLIVTGKLLPSRQFFTTKPRDKMENFRKNGKKILGAAFNFSDNMKSGNLEVPKKPVLFLKPTSSYIEEGEDIIVPKVYTKVAHEVELGVIISKKCKDVRKEDAMSYVGGYCLALDLTAQCETAFARSNGLPWTMGKGFDTSTPVSRFLSLDEVKDPHNLELWCKVNSEMRQEGTTADLIFKVPQLIEYISQYMTLEPNDLILTGTPDGANPIYPGDTVECGLGNIVCMKFNVKG